MYPIQYLYKISGYKIDTFDPNEITPKEFQSFAGLNTQLYISTEYKDDFVALDYSMLITDHTTIASATTWDETSSNLTEALVIGHLVDLPGYQPGTLYPKHQLITWDAMNTLNTFNLTYGSYINDHHSDYSYRWKLHDLRISLQAEAYPSPDLSKVIPIVNGVACRPRVVDDVLYAVNGAKLCWHTQDHFTPEIQLLDFSTLGNIKTYDLVFNAPILNQNFKVEFNFLSGNDWLFTSPEISLNNYTPLIVLNGHLVLPDKIKLLDEYHFTLNVDSLPLNKISGYRAYLESRVNGKAEIAYTSETLDELLTLYPENNFIILVETNRLLIKRIILDVWNNDMIVNLRQSEGILNHHGSGTIRNYHAERLNEISTLTIQNSIPIYITDALAHIEQTTIIEPESYSQEFDNVQASQCSMIYIMR